MQDFQTLANTSFYNYANSEVEVFGQDLLDKREVYFRERYVNYETALDKLASMMTKWINQGGSIRQTGELDTIVLLNTKQTQVATYWIERVPSEKEQKD